MDDTNIVKDLIESERQHFMRNTIRRLSEIDDYDLFVKEIALIANYTEYRKNLYVNHIEKIWLKQLRLLYSNIDSVTEVVDLNRYKDKFAFTLLNEIDELINKNNLSFIEAWEEKREEIEHGDYSVLRFIDETKL